MRFGHCGYNNRGVYSCQAVYVKEEEKEDDDDDYRIWKRTTNAAVAAALPEEQLYSTKYCAQPPRWLTTAAFRRMTISFVVLLKVRFSSHFFPYLTLSGRIRETYT